MFFRSDPKWEVLEPLRDIGKTQFESQRSVYTDRGAFRLNLNSIPQLSVSSENETSNTSLTLTTAKQHLVFFAACVILSAAIKLEFK